MKESKILYSMLSKYTVYISVLMYGTCAVNTVRTEYSLGTVINCLGKILTVYTNKPFR